MPKTTYKDRRQKLFDAMPKNSIAFLATNKVVRRNNDVDYKYRSDSSFFYLTGFAEPESALVLEKNNVGETCYTLFCRKKDALKELWDGKRAGVEGAMTIFGADQAFEITEINSKMPEMLLGNQTVFCRMADAGFNNTLFAHKMDNWLSDTITKKRGDGVPAEFVDINPIIYEMRLVKSSFEIAQMKTAANISAEAHKRAMQTVKTGMLEYALEAELLYVMQKSGCQVAYNSIVAGGENACILHYCDNNKPLSDGDLVLIDAGAEYQHYSADITRTFPVNGKFSKHQREIYNVVLKSQLDAMTELKVGNPAKAYHHKAVKTIVKGLIDLGLLTGTVSENIEKETYKDFFMHGTGHWLGMDVHDVGAYNVKDVTGEFQDRLLVSGMVVTVEPGIYIAPDNINVPECYRGIGIRIEDDVLITDGDPVVLTNAVPKTIEAIENLMSKNKER